MSGTISHHIAMQYTVTAICAACGHTCALDLHKLAASGLGERAIGSLSFSCTAWVGLPDGPEIVRCGCSDVQFVIGSAKADRSSD